MPTPRADETQDEFIARCIPIVLEDSTAEDSEQATAVCYSMWENRDEQGAEEPMSKNASDYRDLPNFERKTIPTFIKAVDEKEGIVEHVVSVFGIRDMQGDRVMPGAYTKTIAERFGKIRTLDQHMADSALRVVGKPRAMREIGRNELPQKVLEEYPEATGGLLAVTQYAMKTDNGRNMFHLVDGGFLPETSIGYDPITAEYVEEEIDGQKVTTRLLKEIRLWEYSNVIWGANPATVTTGTKEADPETDKQTAIDNLTAFLADATLDQRAELWKAWIERTAKQALDPETDDPPRYVGKDEPNGGGGGGIDDGIVDSKELGPDGRPIQRLGDFLTGSIHRIFTVIADDLIVQGYLDQDQRRLMSHAIGLALDELNSTIPDDIMDINLSGGGGFPAFFMAFSPKIATKIGRAISAANARRIQGAIDAAQSALADLEALLSDTMPTEDEPEQDEQAKDAPRTEAATGQETEAGPQTAPTSEELMADINELMGVIERELSEVET